MIWRVYNFENHKRFVVTPIRNVFPHTKLQTFLFQSYKIFSKTFQLCSEKVRAAPLGANLSMWFSPARWSTAHLSTCRLIPELFGAQVFQSVGFDTSVKDAVVVVLSDGSFLCSFSAGLVDEDFSSLFPHFFKATQWKTQRCMEFLVGLHITADVFVFWCYMYTLSWQRAAGIQPVKAWDQVKSKDAGVPAGLHGAPRKASVGI